MRLAAAEKLGYYPTPPKTLQLIGSLLLPQVRTAPLRLLDPCAGEGEALATVAQTLRQAGATLMAYGVEVADSRASKAARVLDRCLHAAWEDVATAANGYGLLWLNPPYDMEAGNNGANKNRLEYTFLRNTLRTLQPGGVLVYIVPRLLLGRANVARFLAGHFAEITVACLPEGEYERFQQVVVVAVRKAIPLLDEETEERLIAYANRQDPPVLDSISVTYSVPPMVIDDTRFFLRKVTLSPSEVLEAVKSNGVYHTRLWSDLVRPASLTDFTPVVPLRVGHVGSLISSGQMGTVHLGDRLAKGRSVKVVDLLDEDGELVLDSQGETVTERERFETRVFTLDAQGEFTRVESVEALQGFLETYAGAIARLLAERFAPLYTQPTEAEWRQVARLLPNKRLPGRNESGLLLAQKHVAIAAARAAKALGYADIIGEMGCGKTTIALATVELLNAYPALVLCPGHLVEKWQREAEAVTPGVRATVIDGIDELIQFVKGYEPGMKVVAVVSKERAKLGSGWRHAMRRQQRRVSYRVPERDITLTEVRHVLVCPRCGATITDTEGVPLAKLPEKRHFCNGLRRVWQGDVYGDNRQGEWIEVPCNEPLYVYHGLRRWPLADYIRKQLPGFFQVLVADECHQFKGKATDQAEAYHHLSLACRYVLNLTGTLFGGKSTDLFWLRYRLDSEVRDDFDFHDESRWAQLYGRLERVLRQQEESKDGVLSGKRRYVQRAKELPGISPAIFRRLLPSCIFVRITDLGWQLPPYREEIVRLEMNPVQRRQYQWLDNELFQRIQHGMSSHEVTERSLAKALVSVWLQNCLSRPNSGFREEQVFCTLDGRRQPVLVEEVPDFMEVHEAHDDASESDEVFDPLLDGFQVEMADDPATNAEGGVSMKLVPVIRSEQHLPKEAWLVQICQEEQAQRRKVLLYVRQTGTRDIQPRLQRILCAAGLQAVILPDNVAPNKREAWIADRVEALDVLITNPRKVETGLDLVRFATCIFYEVEYSLFTLWQAMRRVWRLGQQQPVQVLFPVYNQTMESAALALMGQKMQAACLLYGDNASSAITDEAIGGGNFLAELAGKVLAGEKFSTDGITGLLSQTLPQPGNAIWSTPKEEETLQQQMPDEPVSLWDAWLRQQGLRNLSGLRTKPMRQRVMEQVSQAQLTLF